MIVLYSIAGLHDELMKLEEENNMLKQQLNSTRSALEETLQKLTSLNRNKKKMEKAIFKQLHKTSSILKKAKPSTAHPWMSWLASSFYLFTFFAIFFCHFIFYYSLFISINWHLPFYKRIAASLPIRFLTDTLKSDRSFYFYLLVKFIFLDHVF